jgi:hypothetical protein
MTTQQQRKRKFYHVTERDGFLYGYRAESMLREDWEEVEAYIDQLWNGTVYQCGVNPPYCNTITIRQPSHSFTVDLSESEAPTDGFIHLCCESGTNLSVLKLTRENGERGYIVRTKSCSCSPRWIAWDWEKKGVLKVWMGDRIIPLH